MAHVFFFSIDFNRSEDEFLPNRYSKKRSNLGAASATSRFNVEVIVFMAIMLHKVTIIFVFL